MSQFEVGDSQVRHILAEGLASFDYDVVPMFQKDSLDITDEDRKVLRNFIEHDDASLYVITHGTDTMTDTAAQLLGLPGKSIVLTGALSPARFRSTDAVFNVGMAVAAVQLVEPGIYIVMNGQVFTGDAVSKNRTENRFEAVDRMNTDK
jgi:L-asparaginase